MAETTTVHKEVKRSAGWLIAMGVLMTLVGFLAIGSPFVAGQAVTLTVGIWMVIGGVMQMVYAFRAQSWGSGIVCFLIGGLTLVAGGMVIAHPLMGLGFLTLLLMAWFIVEGIFEVVYAFQLKPLKGWGWTLFSGLMAILLGILIWRQWPVSGAWAVGTLVGIKILFSGSSMIGLGFAARTAIDEAGSSAPA